MAAKKKSPGRPKGSGKSKKPSAASKEVAAASRTKKPVRREVGGLICLVASILSLLGLFGVEGWFTQPLCLLIRGLVGAGMYIAPFALLLDFVVLMFHDGRPVRLRLLCSFFVVMAVGMMAHFAGGAPVIQWQFPMVVELWKTGVDGTSGGLIAGFIAKLLADFFGAGWVVVLLAALLLVVCGLACFNLTIPALIRAFRARPRLEYAPPVREHKDPAEQIVNHVAQKHMEHTERRRAAASDFDLPVDDPPALTPSEEKPRRTARKQPEPAPVVEEPDELELPPLVIPKDEDPVSARAQFEQAVLESMKTPAQKAAPAAEPVEDEPLPPLPEQEVLQKVKREEALAEAALIANQIAESEEEPPQKVYAYPPLSLLQSGSGKSVDGSEEMRINADRLNDTLASFGIDAHITNVIRGPSVTRYELELDRGVKLSKITNLADDIALALGASGVRISAIPDKISVVGVEVPNKLVSTVCISDVIDSLEFNKQKSLISFAVGKDIGGSCIVGDIAKLPHLLIAGTTGSGKSVCMNSLIVSLLYKAKPEEVKMIMVDPKMVELAPYNGIPHLLIPVVTDPKKAAGALQWAVTEMMKRYRLMADAGVKDLTSYNKACAAAEDDRKPLEQIIVIIDELADLMLVAAKEVEEAICRVAQMGRASGIHLVIATQRPSADVITGLMKANIPSRIAFAVASAMESRIILDTSGAEKLVGKGDMLYSPLGQGKPRRVQGCFISEDEVQRVVEFIKGNATAEYDSEVMDQINQKAEQSGKNAAAAASAAAETELDGDEMLPAAVEVILETGQASVSMLQRRLKLGYARAARIVDEMEEKGIVGPFEGSKPRQLLITKEQWRQMQGLEPMEENPPVEEEIP